MKSFFAIASLIAVAAAQRLSILSPGSEAVITEGSQYIVELHQDNTSGSMSQVSVIIAINACYDHCYDPSYWGPATVLYDGPFNPQYNSIAPQKGLYEDFPFTLPADWPLGGSVIQVAHTFKLGAAQYEVFDYSNVHINVVNQTTSA